MADTDFTTPRVFLARHGQTEWTKNGRYTGTTELDLTDVGRQQVLGTSRVVVGMGNLIDPARLGQVFVSPRNRAQQTFDLLFGEVQAKALKVDNKVETAVELAEWNYGAYEGLLTSEILARRRGQGLDQGTPWNIWIDGCENGESAIEVAARIDTLISKIRDVQGPNMNTGKPCDVVLISHGHLLRAFVKRWLGCPLNVALSLMLEPGGVGVLSYEHHNIQEPALMVGMALPFRAEPEHLRCSLSATISGQDDTHSDRTTLDVRNARILPTNE